LEELTGLLQIMKKNIFHLAFPSHNLDQSEKFYIRLGAQCGRRSEHALILNLGGHQIVAQKVKELPPRQRGVYPRHFGLVFQDRFDWEKLLKRAKNKKLKFYQAAKIRYPNTPLEHRSFFLEDPSHNLLEFKHYSYSSALFGEKTFKKVGEETRKK